MAENSGTQSSGLPDGRQETYGPGSKGVADPVSGEQPTVFINPSGDRNVETPKSFGASVKDGSPEAPLLPEGEPDIPQVLNPTGDRNVEDASQELMGLDGLSPGPQEQQAEKPKEEPGKAPPQTAEKPEGEKPGAEAEESAASTEDEDVGAILDKYNHDPKKLGVAYRNIQRLATAKDNEKKEILGEFERAQKFIETVAEVDDDGQYVLRPEAAVDRLNTEPPPVAQIDERAIQAQVVQEWSERLQKAGVDPEDIPERLAKLTDDMKADVAARKQSLTQQAERQHEQAFSRARKTLQRIMDQHENLMSPKIEQRLDRWLSQFPHAYRPHLINNGWLDVRRIIRVEHALENFQEAVREAYRKGRKAANGQEAPSDVAPSPGTRALGDTELTEQEATKRRIMSAERTGARGLKSLKSLIS